VAGSEVGALRLRARKTEFTNEYVRPGSGVVDAALLEDGPGVDLPEEDAVGGVLRGGGDDVDLLELRVGQHGTSVAIVGIVVAVLREVAPVAPLAIEMVVSMK